LRLRSLHVSVDWDEYWNFDLLQEYKRNHPPFYSNGVPLVKFGGLVPLANDDNLFCFLRLPSGAGAERTAGKVR
jgi:hypothetical protein